MPHQGTGLMILCKGHEKWAIINYCDVQNYEITVQLLYVPRKAIAIAIFIKNKKRCNYDHDAHNWFKISDPIIHHNCCDQSLHNCFVASLKL